MVKKYIIFSTFLLSSSLLFAQKKPLDHSVYDNWKNISYSKLSPTGSYVYYVVNPQEGDTHLYLKSNTNKDILEIPRGVTPFLTKNENHFVSLIKAPFAETRQAKIKKKKADEMPKDSLAIFEIKGNNLVKFGQVKSFKASDKNDEYFGFISNIVPASAETTAAKKEKAINVLSIFNFTTGDTTNFERVDDFFFSQTGNEIVFTKKAAEKDSIAADAGLYLYDLTTKTAKRISSGKGEYKSIAFDENSAQLAFLADKSPEKSLAKNFNLYYYTAAQDSAIILANQSTTGIPQNWYVSGDGQVKFSKDGEKLFFGLAPIPKLRDTTLVEFENAKVDIWSWNEDYLHTQQIANKKRIESENYLAVTFPKQGRQILPLLNEKINNGRLPEDADTEYILASSDFGKRIATQWDYQVKPDYYLIHTGTGQQTLIAENLDGTASISLDGNYVVYFNKDDNNWYSYEVATKKLILLTSGIPVSFVDELNDSPAKANPYGIAGWATNHKGVYIYDRYDIWYFDLSGKDKYISTNGFGRANNTVYRYENIDPEVKSRAVNKISADAKYIVNSFNEITKENGFYEVQNKKNKNPKQIIEGKYTFRQLSASKNKDLFSYTKENYVESPNLYISKNFKQETAISDINPQQQDYNWGTAELVHWTTPAGYDAEGILYKPEDFDPNKKYPIIAYFYETLSSGLYGYQAPAPTPSRLNISYFVSNGYLVFAPDIHYTDGHPGKSAEEYINSGMKYLAQNPWVDSSKMAIQGQSWGGYQVAHLITRTDMYAAAWTGAPVVNMTSAYGGIRWQTGMSRQFQYEKTQSRIGKTLWEDRDLYIENSPLFFMDRVTTPVVIMANDNDGAVPWYQGIEMFTALRRLQKPVWMLNYNGDEHNLMLRQNRKDIQQRQQQFFDHFLKGLPAPNWIKYGVPHKDKGIDWGFTIE